MLFDFGGIYPILRFLFGGHLAPFILMVLICWRLFIMSGRIFITSSISCLVVSRPSEKRMELWATSASLVVAIMTWLGLPSPAAQAEPVEIAISALASR